MLHIGRLAPPVFRPQLARRENAATTSLPSGSLRPPPVIQRLITIGEGSDDEIQIDGSFLPPIRNRQKTTLSSLLSTLNNNKKKFAKLQLALSSKNLAKLSLNEVQGIEVLRLLDQWAASRSYKFSSWDEAVAKAAEKIRGSVSAPLVSSSSLSSGKSKEETEIAPCFNLFDSVFQFVLPGKVLTAERYKSIVTTSVNIHGETTGGSLATLKHIKLGAERCYLWRHHLQQLLVASAPCAQLLQLSRARLLITVMRRIIAGSVQEGKCKMMVISMQQIQPILVGLQSCCSSGRVTTAVWNNIKNAFVTVFWGVQAKNMSKLCRELGSTLQVLRADPALTLTGYEQKSDLVTGEVSELDLEFRHLDTLAPPELFNLEIESEKAGTKTDWDMEAAVYYGDRWAGKARRFAQLGKNAKLYFMVANHPTMPLIFPEIVESYVRERYGFEIKVLTPALIGLNSIHRQLIALQVQQRQQAQAARRGRSLSRSQGPEGGSPPGRRRSASF